MVNVLEQVRILAGHHIMNFSLKGYRQMNMAIEDGDVALKAYQPKARRRFIGQGNFLPLMAPAQEDDTEQGEDGQGTVDNTPPPSNGPTGNGNADNGNNNPSGGTSNPTSGGNQGSGTGTTDNGSGTSNTATGNTDTGSGSGNGTLTGSGSNTGSGSGSGGTTGTLSN